jgi:hypothetical protein
MAAILGEAVRNSILKTMKLQGLCCIPGYWLFRRRCSKLAKKRKFFPLFAAKHEYDGKFGETFSSPSPASI